MFSCGTTSGWIWIATVLERAGYVLALEPKALDLLALLVSHPGHLFGKQEIFDTLWPDTAVTDSALTRVIAQLRRVLADEARDPRFIETVPTRGYRWKCAVRVEPPAEAQRRATTSSAPALTNVSADITSGRVPAAPGAPAITSDSSRPATTDASSRPWRTAHLNPVLVAMAAAAALVLFAAFAVDERPARPVAGGGHGRCRRGPRAVAGAGDHPPRPRHGAGLLASRRCAGVRLGPQRRDSRSTCARSVKAAPRTR